ncbi:MAG: hypothetical protein H7Z12_17275 [Rhodospirillaceae bacterium]|nr:hypothetical protein [Rhodospirillales bacterium]
MPIPDARPGLVFRYEYLWKRQARAGRSVAEKERPACIVVALHRAEGDTRVVIVPITHSPPREGEPAVELPPRVKVHLGLDDSPSWIVLAEANIDIWPSPDMRPIPGRPGRFDYGLLPLKLLNQIRAVVLESIRAKRLDMVDRDTSP